MLLNRGGALSADYFASYMKLIMNTRECSLNEAKDMTFQRLFRGQVDTLGAESYQKFIIAYESLR